MKHLIGSLLALLVLSACAFHPIVDTRSSADATATHTLPTATATATLAATEAAATEVAIEATLVATPAPECLLKGNINSRGEKIVHVPGGASYERTIIDPEHGEKWFCTIEEATAAGWRPVKK